MNAREQIMKVIHDCKAGTVTPLRKGAARNCAGFRAQ